MSQVEVALMVEGQDGLNWQRWQRIARTAEDAGYVGLYRSDHFTNPAGPLKDSLECWISLAWLASQTSRIEFGPLVSPMSFHHPSMLVRIAAAIGDLSGGRLYLAIGAGWQEREHTSYSYRLGDVPERMRRFREAVQIMAHLLRDDSPLTFEGKHYSLRDAVLLPRPSCRVPIVIGGSGRKVTLPLAARYADEWNTGPTSPESFREMSAYLDRLIEKAGRQPSSLKRSMMLFVRYGRDRADLDARLAARPVPEFLRRGTLIGTAAEIKDRVAALADAGVQRVMINWRDDYDDVKGMAALGKVLLN